MPAYALRIEASLYRLQFPSLIEDVAPAVVALLDAVDAVLNNAELQELLLCILELGNFINAGSFAGNASGFAVCQGTSF